MSAKSTARKRQPALDVEALLSTPGWVRDLRSNITIVQQQMALILQKQDRIEAHLLAHERAVGSDLGEICEEQKLQKRMLGKLLLAFGNISGGGNFAPLNDADMALIRSWVGAPYEGNGAAFRDD